MALLLLLNRMNPSVCVFGSTDTVLPDDGLKLNATSQTDDSSTSDGDGSPRVSAARKIMNSSPQLMDSCSCLSNSKFYSPNDQEEPLLSDEAIMTSLEKVVPEYLTIVTSKPPSSSSGAFSQKETRMAIKEFNLKKTTALQQLHDLTIKSTEYNRVPMIQTQKWNIIKALAMALIDSCHDIIASNGKQQQQQESMDEDRRLILWTLNNLSIPYENKHTMALGDHASLLLKALMVVIQCNLPESYLSCICIMNLTFLADAIKPVTFYVVPPPNNNSSMSRSLSASGGVVRNRSINQHRPRHRRSLSSNGVTVCAGGVGGDVRHSEVFGAVLGNPSSLLCTIESMMITNAPFLLSSVTSVQGEAIRRALGFIRNVTHGGDDDVNTVTEDGSNGSVSNTQERRNGAVGAGMSNQTGRQGSISKDSIEEICILISRTEIPRLIVQFVRDSPNPTVKWTKESLEDLSLGILCNLTRFSSPREALMRAGAVDSLERMEGLPGIHGYRARAIRVSLGALPKQFG
ncbi:hypothetical protein ACHAWC_001818 [Mediolabrus comicus]